jgi:hypothetical protein
MKTFRGVISIAADIALRKMRAGVTRFGRTDSTAGKPREVYLAGCASIAGQLASEGFTFSRSGPHCRRRRGEFVDEIAFQSSPSNVAGEYVALWIHVYVRSKRIKQWRKEHPLPGSVAHDFVLGGQIGNLLPSASWLEWNLALDPAREIDDAMQTIRNVALPYFKMSDDIGSLASRVTEGEVAGIHPVAGLELLLCFASRRAAEDSITAFFRRRPDLLPVYLQTLDRYRLEGVPAYYPNHSAKDLAKVTIVYGLTPSVR